MLQYGATVLHANVRANRGGLVPPVGTQTLALDIVIMIS